jgi:hypothetical protein
LYRKEYPFLLLYLPRGLIYTFDFLEVSSIIRIKRLEASDSDYSEKIIRFKMSKELCIECDRYMYENSHYVQSILGTFLTICKEAKYNTKYEELNNQEYWFDIFGKGDIYKGSSLYSSSDRLLDVSTKKILKIDDCYKQDVPHLLKWMALNYVELRKVNNYDIANKRIRAMELLSVDLNKRFSASLNRISKIGEKLTLDDLTQVFHFSPELLINALYKIKMIKYDDTINDQDMLMKYKYSKKGRVGIQLFWQVEDFLCI